VILGTGQESAKEANLPLARELNVPVLRRHSGGGAVVIGPGVLNFSAFYRIDAVPGLDTIRGAMTTLLRPVVAWMATHSLRAVEAGLSDLAISSEDGTLRKIAGNSQARKRRSVVVHGTLLADPDFERISRLLHFPSSVPDYRAGRAHRAFLTSLKEQGLPHDLSSLVEGLSTAAQLLSREPLSGILMVKEPRQEEAARAQSLLAEKYAKDEWNLRR
jgi:lipoate-protein ligase A